jgi:hypothetical protein
MGSDRVASEDWFARVHPTGAGSCTIDGEASPKAAVLVWNGGGCRTFVLSAGEALIDAGLLQPVGIGAGRMAVVYEPTALARACFAGEARRGVPPEVTAALDDWAAAVVEAAASAWPSRPGDRRWCRTQGRSATGNLFVARGSMVQRLESVRRVQAGSLRTGPSWLDDPIFGYGSSKIDVAVQISSHARTRTRTRPG